MGCLGHSIEEPKGDNYILAEFEIKGDAFEEEIPFDPPFIVKHRRGHGGSRVLMASSHKDALDKMQGTEPSEWIIQRMCDEPGCDMRLYMLGGKVLAGGFHSLRRHAGHPDRPQCRTEKGKSRNAAKSGGFYPPVSVFAEAAGVA